MGKMKALFALLYYLCSTALYSQGVCDFDNRYLEEVFLNVIVTSGIQYGNADPYGLINSQNLALDIYEPEGDTLQQRPLIVHAFGGGFLIGARNEPDIPNWGSQYAKRGFIFVSIDYRIGFNVTDQNSAVRAAYRSAQDLRSALRFLADSAEVYRIDLDNVFLTGSSAGCFAALIQSFMNEDDRPTSTYGTLLEPQNLGCANCTGNNNNNNLEVPVHAIVNNWGAILDTAYINLNEDPADNIPIISFHGTNDLIVPYNSGYPFSLPIFPVVHGSELIHHRLEQQGIYNRLYPLPGLGHEPELINRWVTDTIVENASLFLYEIMRPALDSISGDSYVCVGDTQLYTLNYNLNLQYCWNVTGGNIISFNLNQIEIEWGSSGLGIVELSVFNDIHAKNQYLFEVEIGSAPDPEYTYDSEDGLIDFVSLDTNSIFEFWDFGDGNTSTNQDPQHQYTDTGSYIVIHTLENQYCSKSKIDTIVSDICPVAAFAVQPQDSSAIIDNISMYGSEAIWDFGNGVIFNGFNPKPIYDEDGVYNVQLILNNDFCSDTFSTSFEIALCPEAMFEIEQSGLEVQINNNSSNSYFNYWNFGNGDASRLLNPVITYDTAGTYEISLIVFNDNNCSDTLSKQVNVQLPKDTLISSVNIDNDFWSINIYPNPVRKIINIDIDPIVKNDVSFILTDISGKVFYSNSLIPAKLDLSYLESGVYFLKIKIGDRLICNKIFKY